MSTQIDNGLKVMSGKADKPGPARRTALFLLHNFNDIDHMTPVIASLAGEGSWRCQVMFYPRDSFRSVNYESDWRLAHLAKQYGVEIGHVRDVDPALKMTGAILAAGDWLLRLCKRTPRIGSLFGRDLRGLLPWFWTTQAWNRLTWLWLRRLAPFGRRTFAAFNPNVVVIDWVRNAQMVEPVLAEASRRNVPILELPSGAWTYEGTGSKPSEIGRKVLAKRRRIQPTASTAIAIENVYKGRRFESMGKPRNTLRYLGLPRFTRGWIEELSEISAGRAKLSKGPRPRLVWFTTWLSYSDRESVVAALDVVCEFADRIDFCLKVHTRGPDAQKYDYGSLLGQDSRVRIVSNEIESITLSHWADAVMATQTSVVYDAMALGKPFLYLKFTHALECLWEPLGAAHTIGSLQDMRSVLTDIAAGRYCAPYAESDLERFLRFGAHGGLSDKEVLPAYLALFDQAVRHVPITAGLSPDEAEQAWRQECGSIADQQRIRDFTVAPSPRTSLTVPAE